MDDIICPHCLQECLYHDNSTILMQLLEILVPKISDSDRYVNIFLVDWKLSIEIIEDEILVGKISVNSFEKINDYAIEYYFIEPSYFNEQYEYLEKLISEIKLYYDTHEFHDGEHPIRVKMSISI